MKITSKTDATYRYAQLQSEVSKAKESKQLPSTDSVSISPTARLLQECLAAEEPFDQAKVAALKAALEQGTYQIDANVLANKLWGEIKAQRVIVR